MVREILIKIKLVLPPTTTTTPPQEKIPPIKRGAYGHGGFPAERIKKCQQKESWWEFRAEKKYLAPPPPKFPADTLPARPPWHFSIKIGPPPSPAHRAPPSPPPSRKIENIRNVHLGIKKCKAPIILAQPFPAPELPQCGKLWSLDGPIRANRLAASCESSDSRESFQGSQTEPHSFANRVSQGEKLRIAGLRRFARIACTTLPK